MTREADLADVFGLLAEPIGEGDSLIIDDAVIGAVADTREIGEDDLEAEDAERQGGRIAFRKEEATA